MTKRNNLRDLREHLGMSQKEFAEAVGLSYTTYNGYETGARQPRSGFWMDVARKYGVTVDYLIGYTDDPGIKVGGENDVPSMTEEALEIGHLFAGMDKRGQDVMRAVAKLEAEQSQKTKESVLFKFYSSMIRSLKIDSRSHGFCMVPVLNSVFFLGVKFRADEKLLIYPYFPEYEVPADTDFGIHIYDDSMSPNVPHMATAFMQASPVLANGEVGLFMLNGKGYCRQLIVEHQPLRVFLHPLNEKYQDIPVEDPYSLHILGRVIAVSTDPVQESGVPEEELPVVPSTQEIEDETYRRMVLSSEEKDALSTKEWEDTLAQLGDDFIQKNPQEARLLGLLKDDTPESRPKATDKETTE